MIRTQDEWIQLFGKRNAYWRHDDNPKRPHAVLTDGGYHSNGFFYWSMIAQDPALAQDAADNLLHKLRQQIPREEWDSIQRVVGPGAGAITLADRLAGSPMFNSRRVLSGFTEKTLTGDMSLRFVIKNEAVLVCEDTLTTGGSLLKTIAAIRRSGGRVLPTAAVICNRSGLQDIEGRKIVALIETPMQNWSAAECPLCQQGSKALYPKRDNNWEQLNAQY